MTLKDSRVIKMRKLLWLAITLSTIWPSNPAKASFKWDLLERKNLLTNIDHALKSRNMSALYSAKQNLENEKDLLTVEDWILLKTNVRVLQEIIELPSDIQADIQEQILREQFLLNRSIGGFIAGVIGTVIAIVYEKFKQCGDPSFSFRKIHATSGDTSSGISTAALPIMMGLAGVYGAVAFNAVKQYLRGDLFFSSSRTRYDTLTALNALEKVIDSKIDNLGICPSVEQALAA
jgi:hypothetical protein